jgi:hypothetical protein
MTGAIVRIINMIITDVRIIDNVDCISCVVCYDGAMVATRFFVTTFSSPIFEDHVAYAQ